MVESLVRQGCAVQRQEGDRAAVLTSPDGTGQTVVERPDTEDYHQAGWDIRVTTTTEAKNYSYYLEVKTHTPGSAARSLLPLSNEQMRLAAEKGSGYIVLEVIYDEGEERAVAIHSFPNILDLIRRGALYFPKGRCLLSCCGNGTEPGGRQYEAETRKILRW